MQIRPGMPQNALTEHEARMRCVRTQRRASNHARLCASGRFNRCRACSDAWFAEEMPKNPEFDRHPPGSPPRFTQNLSATRSRTF
jgi:hypothetical protein